MRLVCPNCDAEYEVDDAAIPRGGRDVQCSNCGHAWFQAHPEVEAEQVAEADLYEAPAGAVAAPEAVSMPERAPAPRIKTTPVAEVPPAPPQPEVVEESLTEAAPPPVPPQPRTLDETVLAVLREEAEREAKARRTETAAQPVIETQTEMPLAQQDQGGLAAAVRRIARLRSGDEPEPVPTPPPAIMTRGQMLPAIEEINSTLRSTSDRTADEDGGVAGSMADAAPRSGGFKRGFTTLVVLAVVIVVLYLLAPVIAAKVPALAGAAAAYVAAVDVARVWLDVHLRSLIATLRGLAGGQGG